VDRDLAAFNVAVGAQKLDAVILLPKVEDESL
jgi:hypothetical protein